MGRLIPAGTGMEYYRRIEVENALADMQPEEEPFAFEQEFGLEDMPRIEEEEEAPEDNQAEGAELEAEEHGESGCSL